MANDTDVDSPSSSLRAVVVVGPAVGNTLTLNTNGGFTYTPAPAFFGNDTFTYKVYDGCLTPEVQCSTYSNTVTVTMTVIQLNYGFVNSLNLPPPGGKSFKTANLVMLAWQWTLNGLVADTPDADSKPSIVIVRPTGGTLTYTPAAPGLNSFQYSHSDEDPPIQLAGQRRQRYGAAGRNVQGNREAWQDRPDVRAVFSDVEVKTSKAAELLELLVPEFRR